MIKKIFFFNSHIYPGCLASVTFRVSPNFTLMRISIEFSDASFTTGDLELVSSGALILYTDPYITTAGAKIPNKV